MRRREPRRALAFLKAVYQSRSVPLAVRMKAAIEALPFERPSLRATAAVIIGGDFVARLERAIERSAAVRNGGEQMRVVEPIQADVQVPLEGSCNPLRYWPGSEAIGLNFAVAGFQERYRPSGVGLAAVVVVRRRR